MNKIFTAAALGLFLLAGTSVANAAEDLTTQPIVQGTEYTISSSTDAPFTAPFDGTLTISLSGYAGSCLYQEDSDDSTLLTPFESSLDDSPYYYKYSLNANQTVYYIPGFIFDTYTATFTFEAGEGGGTIDEPYTLVSMTPESGTIEIPAEDNMPTITIILSKAAPQGREPYITLNANGEQFLYTYMNEVAGSNMTQFEKTVPDNYLSYYKAGAVITSSIKVYTGNGGESVDLEGNTWTVASDDSGTTTPEPGDDVDAEEIVVEQEFTIDSSTSLVWVYTPTADVPNFYFEIGPYENNVFEVSSFGDYLAFSTNADGSDPISLEYIAISDGGIYAGTNLEANTPYYLVVLNNEYDTAYYTATLYTKEYVSPSGDYVTVEVPFTVSSTQTAYQFNSQTEGDFYLVSDSNVNLLENGTLSINTYGYNIFSEDNLCYAVEGPDGVLYYTGLYFQSDTIYDIEYTGSETIELTIVPGTYGTSQELGYAFVWPQVISATDPMSSVELSWGQEVSIAAGSEEVIPVYMLVDGADSTFKGNLTLTYLQMQSNEASEPGIWRSAEFGDTGTSLLILTGASGLFTEAGDYQIVIPEGLVQNEDGAVNPEDYITITVTALAEYTSIEPASFVAGEEVIITISYDGEITPGQDDEVVVRVLNYNDPESEKYYDMEFTWADDEVLFLNEDKDAIILNLGNALPEGTYELYVEEGVYTVNGIANDMISWNFTISEDTEGVNSIGAALEGNEAIYNLQGVKVDANKLSKGIYIINGKKVLVK